jgi:hypothetical protein
MLKLQNHYKLCNKPVGVNGWRVDFCGERTQHYEIKLEHDHLSSIKVYLQRQKSLHIGGRSVYRFYDENFKATIQSVTADYIVDINNLLKTLEKFTH